MKNFPFDNFSDFQKTYEKGNVNILMNLTLARDWLLYKGEHCYLIWWLFGVFLSWLPFFIAVGFSVYMLFNRPIFLLTLPLFFVAYLISSPYSRNLGFYAKVIAIIGFLLSDMLGSPEWAVVFASTMGIMVSLWTLNQFAQTCFLQSICTYEDLAKKCFENEIIKLDIIHNDTSD